MNQQLPILSAQALFERLSLDPIMNQWRSLSGLDNKVFDTLFLEPTHRFAEAVQLAPASESHHHSGPGGLLKHTVDVITIALKKRRGFQLPLGGSISDILNQRHLWTYGIFVACLLHDIGKMSASTRLILLLKDDTEKNWTPHDEPLTTMQQAMSYRIQFQKTPYEYHHRIALTSFDVLPRIARAWLAQAPVVMAQLCAYLWGDRFESGIIGEIAEAADRESTARDLKLPSEQRFSSSVPVIERYLRMIRQWIADGAIRINSNGGMGWVDNDSNLYLVCRSFAEKIIQESLSLGLKNLPQDPIRIYDIFQEHGYALPTPEGKAIWNVKIKTTEFTHQFTCLKFEARKLTVPTKPLSPLKGEIVVLDAKNIVPENDADKNNLLENNNEKFITHEADNHQQDTDKKSSCKKSIQQQNTMQEHEEKTDSDIEAVKEIIKEHTLQTNSAIKMQDTDNQAPVLMEGSDTPRRFVQWIKKGLIEKTLLINDVNAEVHIVEEGVFLLAPAIFKTFLNKHNLTGEVQHKNLSRRFGRLRLHVKAEDGLNIHTYWVCSSNRATKINGWLLPFNVIYEHDYPIPKPNKYLRKKLNV